MFYFIWSEYYVFYYINFSAVGSDAAPHHNRRNLYVDKYCQEFRHMSSMVGEMAI